MAEFAFPQDLPFNPLDILNIPEIQRLFSLLKSLALIVLVLYLIEHLWKWYSDWKEKRKINKILQDVEDIKIKLDEIEHLLKKPKKETKQSLKK